MLDDFEYLFSTCNFFIFPFLIVMIYRLVFGLFRGCVAVDSNSLNELEDNSKNESEDNSIDDVSELNERKFYDFFVGFLHGFIK